MNAELQETRQLCKALTQFLGNYLHATRGTGDAAAAEKAAGRVTDALTDCLSKAIVDFAESEPDGRRKLPMTFECTACGPHDLARDRAVLESGQLRHGIDRGSIEERHAKEVVRQLELRGWKTKVEVGELAPA